MATRKTQPYRRGRTRQSGLALDAMRRGKPFYSPHPMDPMRIAAKRRKRRRRLSDRKRRKTLR